ncbi:MAG TPA: VOC family protein [Gemmatimonadaceae bacterium]|nr:VOC family protein [Gemmatimonadaceae bacterium]
MSTATQLALSRIGQIQIPVQALDRAVRFYRDTLGVRFLFQVPNLAFFDAGGVRLMLGVPEQKEHQHPASVLYYVVDDIQRAYDTLHERGVQFVDKPHLIAKLEDHDLWMCFFHDSESNMVALMSEVRR